MTNTPSTRDEQERLAQLAPLRDIIAAYGLGADKKLGQHFLLDGNITDKIVRCAGDLSGQNVIEIGPGPGGLTRSLLRSNALSVTAIERDPRCLQALQSLSQATSRLRLINGDALESVWEDLLSPPCWIIANLPYNIGTELLIHWLRRSDLWQGMLLMFQSEVADRIYARPNSKTYGRLAILAQACTQPEIVYRLPAQAFVPPPKVTSAVVRFTPRAGAPSAAKLARLEMITAAAFGQRRKMLRSSLASFGGEPFLRAAGLDPNRRAEQLTVDDFLALASINTLVQSGPFQPNS
jgi:16S rRNA (adenine1518-N6/adenine1519-N6)-dimethyltransferase